MKAKKWQVIVHKCPGCGVSMENASPKFSAEERKSVLRSKCDACKEANRA